MCDFNACEELVEISMYLQWNDVLKYFDAGMAGSVCCFIVKFTIFVICFWCIVDEIFLLFDFSDDVLYQ